MIQTLATVHRVSSAQAYRELVARKIDTLIKRGVQEDPTGQPLSVRDDDEPISAYINHGRWVVDCDCGSGNMVEPTWLLAGCLACGRIHTNVVMPEGHGDIERELTVRTRPSNRNWVPGESAADLRAETERFQPARGRR